MIKFVTGKPGGGKTLRCLRLILDEIKKGENGRCIITNIPLEIERITQYIEEKAYHYDPAKIIILRVDTLGCKYGDYLNILRRFFYYRSSLTPEPETKSGEELTLPQGSVLYLIDEIHKLWPAQGWMESKGDRVFEYLAEHRHFGDDVVFITQALAQVNKQIRLLGQDFEVVRNRGKEKIKWFAGPKEFKVYCYLSAPNGSGNQAPADVWAFRLDEIAGLYNTSAKGGDADKGKYAKGIPYYYIVPTFALLAFGFWYIVTSAPKYVAARFAKTPNALVSPPKLAHNVVSQSSPVSDMPDSYLPVYVTGMYILKDSITIYLSNGEKITELDTGLEKVDYDYIVYRGEEIRLLGK